MNWIARTLLAFSAVSVVLWLGYVGPSQACTDPSEDAGDVVVVPEEGNDGGSGAGGADTGEDPGGAGDSTGSGDGSGSGDGTGSGSGSGDSFGSGDGADPDSSEDPGPPVLTSFVEGLTLDISWDPGRDVDADPNESAWWRHQGHTIYTRVAIFRDGALISDSLIPQYDTESGERGDVFDAIARTRYAVDGPGAYRVAVQSVFERHGEVKFGLDGRWGDAALLDDPPQIDPSMAGSVSFAVAPEVANDGAMSGGCELVPRSALGMLLCTMLLFVPRMRRRTQRRV